jgi:5-deoxy-glucuronate isomerase
VKQPELRFHNVIKGAGYQEIASPACAPLEHITLGLQCLRAGDVHRFTAPAEEAVFVLLNGRVEIAGTTLRSTSLTRESVFAEPASALYIRPGDEIAVRAQRDSEMAVVRTRAEIRDGSTTQVILPGDLCRREVGRDNWRRIVYDIVPGEFAAQKLIVGETFNPPGNWSSSPPHKHDRDDPPRESKFEEVYFYRFDPPQGFALQRVYSADRDLNVCYPVEHNDAVVLPRGYHPVVAAPGYRLYYLWLLAGQSREPVWSEDPAHCWIHNEAGKD